MISDRKILSALVILAITQLIGWGTIGFPAVVGRQVAADLQMDLAAVFAGSSVLYLTMGLCAPLLATPFVRYGGRVVMMASVVAAVPGFVLISFAHGPLLYFSGWLLLGVAGSAGLSTASYILLSEIAGQKSKSAIGALMLVTWLSSSLFWPITSLLESLVGWRGTCLVYAGAILLISLPLYTFALPRRAERDVDLTSNGNALDAEPPAQSTFYLLVLAIALNAFVQFGLSAVLIELFKAEGLSAAEAVSFASTLGVVQISARAIDFVGAGRWDGITTGLVAGVALPVAMLLLMVSGGSYGAIAAFILIYGLGSGALAVARATMPLVFYDKVEFAKASSRIALPLNVLSAISPPVLVILLNRFGSNALLTLTLVSSLGALAILMLLRQRRPTGRAVTAA